MQSVEIIADSVNTFGQRITTVKATFWRALLAEVNTHRMLTRNSASSRAIRFEKMVESVMTNPFIPLKWQKDHPGMQGTEYFEPPYHEDCQLLWLESRDSAVKQARELNEYGVTKQLCNRLLEPFMYHTALITGTEFENFVALRAHADAEIHFQDLAYKFLDAMNASTPKQLQPGEYHIPFGDQLPEKVLIEYSGKLGITEEQVKIRIATVRAARISYANMQNASSWDYAADLELHDRLAAAGHMSAFEHCARAMTEKEYYSHMITDKARVYKDDHIPQGTLLHHERVIDSDSIEFGWCKNFRGFIQYRTMFPNENRSDSRLIKK